MSERTYLPQLVSRIQHTWPAIDRPAATMALAQSLEVIRQAVLDGHLVYLPGLGTLGTYTSAPRKGRNPKKPEVTIDIPSKTRVYFTAEKPLIQQLNQKSQ